jgi:antitoxin PrlF
MYGLEGFEMANALVTSKGQITIPKSVRDRLGVDFGDRVEFIESADGVFSVIASTRDVRELKGMVERPAKPVSIADMNRAITKAGGRR